MSKSKKSSWWLMIMASIVLFGFKVQAKELTYGETLCECSGYYCLTIGAGQTVYNGNSLIATKDQKTWQTLWPDPTEREIVMKVNRLNIELKKDMVIAVPKNMSSVNYLAFSPFPLISIDSPGEKMLVFDPSLLAWAAYDEAGNLLNWGPGVGGRDYCPDTGRQCRTRVGTFKIIRKEGAGYRSSRYPKGCQGKGCAPMPYAIFFQENYAFHGSPNVVGKNASHGCVRIFNEDAKWLNKEFVQIGTKVIVLPYPK